MDVRYWTFCEPGSPVSGDPVYITLSDDEIIDQYWDYWCGRMASIGKDLNDFNKYDCIDDWVIVNWAWESEK